MLSVVRTDVRRKRCWHNPGIEMTPMKSWPARPLVPASTSDSTTVGTARYRGDPEIVELLQAAPHQER